MTDIISIPKRIAICLIKLYQIYFSPRFKASCKYHPTCSNYAIQAIDKYGIIKGSFKGVKRILKCHPFSKRRCG